MVSLKVGIAISIVVYWILIGSLFTLGNTIFTEDAGYNYTDGFDGEDLDDIGPTTSPLKILGLVFFGIGLPDDTPTWFSVVFFALQTIIFILAVLVVIDALWIGGS